MRLIMLIAFVLFIVAAIAAAVPTAPLGLSALFWVAVGLVFMALDFLLGWTVAVPVQRRVP